MMSPLNCLGGRQRRTSVPLKATPRKVPHAERQPLNATPLGNPWTCGRPGSTVNLRLFGFSDPRISVIYFHPLQI